MVPPIWEDQFTLCVSYQASPAKQFPWVVFLNLPFDKAVYNFHYLPIYYGVAVCMRVCCF